MKVPTTGDNISTGKTSAFAISGIATQKVFTVVTAAEVMAVAITVEAEVTAAAEITAVAEVATKTALAFFAGAQGRFDSTTQHRFVTLAPAAKAPTKHSPMIRISAKVMQVDRLGNQYLVTVLVPREKYSGTFDRLNFGERKPHLGSYRSGWLDLAYEQNPGLKPGESFPLWAIE